MNRRKEKIKIELPPFFPPPFNNDIDDMWNLLWIVNIRILCHRRHWITKKSTTRKFIYLFMLTISWNICVHINKIKKKTNEHKYLWHFISCSYFFSWIDVALFSLYVPFVYQQKYSISATLFLSGIHAFVFPNSMHNGNDGNVSVKIFICIWSFKCWNLLAFFHWNDSLRLSFQKKKNE